VKNQAEKHKDIARLDQASKRTYGWYVRVQFNGKIHAKLFSDLKHGGRAASLLAAIAWRDSTEKEIGKPRTDRNIVTRSNTNAGVVGVRFNEKLNRYEVSWVTLRGKQGKTTVSILRHGKEKAFKIACERRKEKDAERLQINPKKAYAQ
jgi:hypothetical protein